MLSKPACYFVVPKCDFGKKNIPVHFKSSSKYLLSFSFKLTNVSNAIINNFDIRKWST